MVRLAILGANGQVGAELCLLLAGDPGIELVPVCRNRSGSAFLRWHGIACRHGRIADAAEAPLLVSDCDVVVNCSLATGTPAEIRRTEDRIARHMAAFSAPDAILIHCSTQSVYGDPVDGRLIRWRNPYGRAKLATERSVRRAARRHHKRAVILRLGHVCGALQEISITLRSQLTSGEVVLPAQDHSSNTVHTAAIVGAIRQIIGGGVEPGTYDLMNTPRWTWREVYAREAEQLGVAFRPVVVPTPAPPSLPRRAVAAVSTLAGTLAFRQGLREAVSKLVAHVPASLNDRALAWWYRRRARNEIGSLANLPQAPDHLSWIENGVRFFPADVPTHRLLDAHAPGTSRPASVQAWPRDLPPATGVAPHAPAVVISN